jgi:hypothetical protein
MEFHTLSQPSCSFKPEAGSTHAHTHTHTLWYNNNFSPFRDCDPNKSTDHHSLINKKKINSALFLLDRNV